MNTSNRRASYCSFIKVASSSLSTLSCFSFNLPCRTTNRSPRHRGLVSRCAMVVAVPRCFIERREVFCAILLITEKTPRRLKPGRLSLRCLSLKEFLRKHAASHLLVSLDLGAEGHCPAVDSSLRCPADGCPDFPVGGWSSYPKCSRFRLGPACFAAALDRFQSRYSYRSF